MKKRNQVGGRFDQSLGIVLVRQLGECNSKYTVSPLSEYFIRNIGLKLSKILTLKVAVGILLKTQTIKDLK